jgi:hypothetical protein
VPEKMFGPQRRIPGKKVRDMLIATDEPKKEISENFGYCVSMQLPELHGMSYSKFMGELSKYDIQINRKVLADLAMNNPEAFKAIVDKMQK